MTTTEASRHELAWKIRRVCHFEFSEWTYTCKLSISCQYETRLAHETTTKATWHEMAWKLRRIVHFDFSEWTYTRKKKKKLLIRN